MKDALGVDHPSFDRMGRYARALATQVRRGVMDFQSCANLVERAAQASKRYAHMSETERDRLADWAFREFAKWIEQPELEAVFEIRSKLGPLMAVKTPRIGLLLAAYRVANGRMESAAVEKLVKAETDEFMARMRKIIP